MIGIVDIGGTKLLASTSDDGAELGDVIRRDTPRDDVTNALIDMLDEVRAGSPLSGITLAVPGPFRRTPPGLVNPPGLWPAWHDMNFADTLGPYFGCPVVAENDANCSALAEANAGAGRGHRTVVYYTVSTGIGTGVVRDGSLVVGHHDTEGGHQVLWPKDVGGPRCDCGGFGCLEALASGRAIARRFGCLPEELDDPAAWDDIGRWLGLAVVNATALLDPDIVVFGGGVTAAWDRFEPAMRGVVERDLHLQPIPLIARAELAEGRNNLIGALANLRATSVGR